MRMALIIGITLLLSLTGCSGKNTEQPIAPEQAGGTAARQADAADGEDGEEVDSGSVLPDETAKRIAECCLDIRRQAIEEKTTGTLETVRKTMEALEKEGYAAAHQDNQLDMVNGDQVEAFCKRVEEKQEGKLLLIIVLNNGGFVQFQMASQEGNVDITAVSLNWQGENLVNIDTEQYQAYHWVFTEGGYLFFDKYYMEGLAGPYNHVAVRVKPLDSTCRELNRKYILPVGYYSNNLFITDWNEEDYGSVNFYDLFDILQRAEDSDAVTCVAGNEGEIYQIPEEKFESVIGKYFSVSSGKLREKTDYQAESNTYEYRPRGMYDSGTGADCPFPEVTEYENRRDGTIVLTVHAVWTERDTDAAFCHQVVIRPLKDGSFQYVSNHILPTENQVEPVWYVARLTKEEWQEYYGEQVGE